MLSFIVPAHNEELLIRDALRAIRAAADPLGKPYEIIVANDASTDATARIAAEEGARVTNVELRQISRVRNAGARHATGDRFIFVDADTRVTPQVVRAAVAALAGGCIGGGAVVHFEGRIPFWGRAALLFAMPLYRWHGYAAGCFVFCRRDAFEQIGGFDETAFAAEEVFLSKAMTKLGRFIILREHVISSGRKLRTFSAAEVFSAVGRFMLTGEKALRDRTNPGLKIWYGDRRQDNG